MSLEKDDGKVGIYDRLAWSGGWNHISAGGSRFAGITAITATCGERDNVDCSDKDAFGNEYSISWDCRTYLCLF